jgi:hypothetical protein
VANLESVELPFFTEAPKIIRTQGIIAAPRSEVFARIAEDPAGWGDWFPGFTHDGRWETPPPHGVGSVRSVKAFRTNYRETVLAWDVNERWAFRVDETDSAAFAAFAEDYRVSDAGTGTRFAWTVAFRPGPVMKLASPLAGPMITLVSRRVVKGLNRVTS